MAMKFKETIAAGYKPVELRVRETELRQTVENTITNPSELNKYVYHDLPKMIGGASVKYVDDYGHWYLVGKKKLEDGTEQEYMATGDYN